MVQLSCPTAWANRRDTLVAQIKLYRNIEPFGCKKMKSGDWGDVVSSDLNQNQRSALSPKSENFLKKSECCLCNLKWRPPKLFLLSRKSGFYIYRTEIQESFYQPSWNCMTSPKPLEVNMFMLYYMELTIFGKIDKIIKLYNCVDNI